MSLIIEVKVVPRSGKQQFVVDTSGQLKCFIKAAPEKGKANAEVIEVIAAALGIKKREVEIATGYTGRKKLIKILANLSYEEIVQKLGSGIQKSLV